MDPVTGLRRTQVSTPIEKALKFVQETEPSFRVKKLQQSAPATDELDDDGSNILTGFKTRAQEIEEERLEILDEMRIRKKTLQHWLSDDTSDVTPTSGGGEDKTESERLYEERKKKLQQQSPAKDDVRKRPSTPDGVKLEPQVTGACCWVSEV